MIRRLKRRMILLVLCGLLLASAGLVTAINWMNWNSISKQANAVLDMLAENEGQRPGMLGWSGINGMRYQGALDRPEGTPPAEQPEGTFPPGESRPFEMGPNGEQFRQNGDRQRKTNAALMNAASLSNFYTIVLNEDGSVASWSSDRQDLYTDEEISQFAMDALAQGKNTGRVGTQFYRITDGKNDQRLLIAVDGRLEVQNAQSVLRVTALVAVAEDVLLSIAAVWLIHRLVKPVDEAMEKQKQFVWDASHELKTPLAVISANAEALSGEIGPSKPLEFIQSEVSRTDHLIQNLLTLARMEKGTAQSVHQRFDLSHALLEVALPFEAAVFEAGKEMEMDIPDGIEYTGDQEMIKQLAVILLSNAEKYSDDGGRIRVSLEAKGEKRILKVHNTGPAIPPEALPRIFDRFYRVDSSHNRDIEGNGLGLAIAQNIVSMHKGKISVHSAEGEGTAFTVVL